MARPNKIGLAYYNVDTDRYSDIKVRRLKNAMGCLGLSVYDYILCSIYRNGGVLVWDENTALDVSEYFGLKETKVLEVINYCCTTGLFNKALFTNGNVITSKSIQERYVFICRNSKIKFHIDSSVCLLNTEEIPKTTEEIPKTTEETPKITEESTQRKRKEKKENKKEEKINKKEDFSSSSNFHSLSEVLISEATQKIDFENSDFLFWAFRETQKDANALKLEFEKFLVFQKANEKKSWDNPQDLRKHFINWLKIEIQKNSKSEKNGKKTITADLGQYQSTGGL